MSSSTWWPPTIVLITLLHTVSGVGGGDGESEPLELVIDRLGAPLEAARR